jgi:hypothetical protein
VGSAALIKWKIPIEIDDLVSVSVGVAVSIAIAVTVTVSINVSVAITVDRRQWLGVLACPDGDADRDDSEQDCMARHHWQYS